MGWFTSNLSGQPHLYPTKKDYEKQHLDEQTQHQKRKQPHIYPLRHDYSSKTPPSRENDNETFQNQKHEAKYILERLNMKNLSVMDLLSILKSQNSVCRLVGKQVQKCLVSAKNINTNDYQSQYCKNELISYRECLRDFINSKQQLF